MLSLGCRGWDLDGGPSTYKVVGMAMPGPTVFDSVRWRWYKPLVPIAPCGVGAVCAHMMANTRAYL